MVLVVFVLVLGLGFCLGWWLRGLCSPRKHLMKTTKVQSQTAYTSYNVEPRFKLLVEREVGAWAD